MIFKYCMLISFNFILLEGAKLKNVTSEEVEQFTMQNFSTSQRRTMKKKSLGNSASIGLQT